MRGFRSDGQHSGAYRVRLHETYPEIVGPALAEDGMADDRPGPNLPTGLRRALPIAARPPQRQLIIAALQAALRLPAGAPIGRPDADHRPRHRHARDPGRRARGDGRPPTRAPSAIRAVAARLGAGTAAR